MRISAAKVLVPTCAAVTVLIAGPLHAQCIGPGNYPDCVRSSMKGVTSDVAAKAIEAACREKFPAPTTSHTDLPASALGQVDGRASFSEIAGSSNTFSGQIYNGNTDWSLTQIAVEVILTTKGEGTTLQRPRTYNLNIAIPPRSNARFCLNLQLPDLKFQSWRIAGARGLRVQ